MQAEQAARPASGYERTALGVPVSAERVLELAGGIDWVLAGAAIMSWPPARAGYGETPSWVGPADCDSVKLRWASE